MLLAHLMFLIILFRLRQLLARDSTSSAQSADLMLAHLAVHLAVHSLSHTDRNDIIRDQGANIPLNPVRVSMDGSA